MNKSEQINELVIALAKAQSEMTPVIRDNSADFTSKTGSRIKYSYADLGSVIESCRKQLSSNGLVVMQTTHQENSELKLITTLAHTSGQWISSDIDLEKSPNPQVFGSYMTYMRRYSYCSILSIAIEDDDGQKAITEKKQPETKYIQNPQWIELNQLIEKCDESYQNNLWEYLNSQDIHSFEKMTEQMFHKIKKGCLSNISKNQPNESR